MKTTDGKLGLWSCVTMIAGGMIGSAIFSLSGMTIYNAGPAAIVSWGLAAFVMLCYGLVCAELSVRYPKSGGVFVFPVKALATDSNPDRGKVWGWISTWGNLNANIVAIAFSAIYVGTYLSVGFPVFAGKQVPLAIASIVLALALNYIHFSTAGKLNNILVAFLLTAMAVYIYMVFSKGVWDSSLLVPFFTQGAQGQNGFLRMVPTAMVAYGSITTMAFMAGEVENPRRNIPMSVFIAMALVLVVYLSTIVSTVGMVSADYLNENPGMRFIPLYAAVWTKLNAYPWLSKVISIAAFLALMTTMLAVLSITARNVRSMAETGLVPACFAVNNKNGVPFNASILVAVVAAVISCFPQIIEIIVDFAALFSVCTICINCVSLLVAKRKTSAATAGFSIPGGSVLPILALAILLVCYIPGIVSGGFRLWAFSIVWYAIGIMFYRARNRK